MNFSGLSILGLNNFPCVLKIHVALSLDERKRKEMIRLRCWSVVLQTLALLLLLSVCVNAKSATGDRVLVIHEEESVQSEFSQFFYSLTGKSSARQSLIS